MSRPPRHVVFGAGAIGLTLVEALHARGETGIRLVSRSGRALVPDGVEVVAGDATDAAFSVPVAAGAEVVYQVLNPPYDTWVEQFPCLQNGVLMAAEASGARLVSMENVYMYGRPAVPMVEDAPFAAHTRKGRVRAQMSRELLAAQRAGRVQMAVGRASDYFGPRGGAQSNIGDRVFAAALSGKAATVLGDPDQPHTYSYIPDIAEGLAVLGTHPDAVGEVWHLPNDPHTRTTREIVELAYAAAGHPRAAKVRSTRPIVLRTLGLWNATVRELVEMLYEFESPFVVDSSKIALILGVTATPLDEAVERTLATYR